MKSIHPDVYTTAFDLLVTYGDTISKSQYAFITQNNPNDSAPTKLISVKQKAIYTYLSMVLRPVWDSNITTIQDLSKLSEQQCNVTKFLPTLSKLERLA